MSAPSGELDLSSLRAALAGRPVFIGSRAIQVGDERAFRQAAADPSAALRLRDRASGAARLVARRLLAEIGADANAELPRLPTRAPGWPAGIVGSLAHDDAFAVAAIAQAADVAALGVDVEPREPLPDDVLDFALSEAERSRLKDPVDGRIVFAGKEAVYKAMNPFDGSPLEYGDIDVDLASGLALLADGRALDLFFSRTDRIVAVALAPTGFGGSSRPDA